MAPTCYDRFAKIIRVTELLASICGANILDKNYKMNFMTWLVIVAINCYFSCTIYTIYIGFVVNGDWKIILESLSLSGSGIQGYTKLICTIKRRSALVSLKEKLESIYKEYEHDKDFSPICRRRIRLTIKILVCLLGIYIFSWLAVGVHPLVYAKIYGQRLLIMKFFLPGIDPTSDSGFLLHNTIHFGLVTLGAFGNFVADIFLFINITNVPLLKDVLQAKCKKLNRVILSEEESKGTMPLLKDIINCHQNYNAYVQEVDEAYYIVIFVQILTSVMSIIFTLFSLITRSWPSALGYLIYGFCLLYAFCGLGHLVELSNDDVIDIIYGDILWYELSVPEQKLVLLMLRKSQASTNLTIGQVMPLSMSTGLQLTKAIYSYMMMLVNFLEKDE